MKYDSKAAGLLLACMALAGSTFGTIIAGWDGAINPAQNSGRAADTNAADIAAAVTWSDNGTLGSHWGISDRASNDETFGTVSGAAAFDGTTTGGALFSKNINNDVYMDFSITNNGMNSFELTQFSFDAWRSYNGGSGAFNLSITAGDLALTNQFVSGTFSAQGANPDTAGSDYEDLDLLLTNLTDRVLGPGESVTIRLALDRSTNPTLTGDVFIDNAAVLADEIVPAGTVIAGWDGASNPASSSERDADTAASGVSASAAWSDDGTLGSHWGITDRGSNDETFGGFAGASAFDGTPPGGALYSKNTNNNVYVDFAVTNNSALAYELSGFSFDAWRSWASGSEAYTLDIVAGDLTTGSVASGTFTIQNANPSNITGEDYEDFDVSLAAVADRVLDPGESVTFRLALDRTANPGLLGDVYIDNVAIIASTASAYAEFSAIEMDPSGRLKLTVHATEAASQYALLATDDLSSNSWSTVAHSDAAGNPLLTTNLSYSTQVTNDVYEIYVDPAGVRRFFGIQF